MPIEPGITVSKEEVLKRITEEEIFEKYLQLPPVEGIDYINPLRVDNSAGCRYYKNNNGRLRFKDFSKGYNWDCFSVVQFIYNCSFYEALKIIVKDFRLNNEVPKHEIKTELVLKIRYDIKIAVRDWNQEDNFYWNQYNIINAGLRVNIFPCKAIWINNEYYRCRVADPCYAYYFGDGLYKLYFPKRKTQRFFTNVMFEDYLLQGYKELPESGELLIVTKSYKDVKSLRAFGIYAVAPQSESQILTKEQYEKLSDRFTYIFCLGDNDSAGRWFCIKHQNEFKIPSLLFPWTMEKDFSDNVKRFGVEYMKELIQKLREENE
jgi:hypothetical protein